jgi:hypothetical protein
MEPNVNPALNEPNTVLLGRELLPRMREELYDAWQAARDQALLAYRIWCAAPSDEQGDAYAAHLAAEDREAAAADHLGRLAEHANGAAPRATE